MGVLSLLLGILIRQHKFQIGFVCWNNVTDSSVLKCLFPFLITPSHHPITFWKQNGTAALEISYKTNHAVTTWPSHCTAGNLHEEVANLCPHQNLHTERPQRLPAHAPEQGSDQRCRSAGENIRRTVLHPNGGLLLSAKKEASINPWRTWEILKYVDLRRSQSG